VSVRLEYIDEFEGKMLTAVREYEELNKRAQPDSLLIRHGRGQAEMYAAAIVALKASREERDYWYSGGI
jgi:hypothetical protein